MGNSSDNSSNISLDNYGIFDSKINYNLSVSDLYKTSISKKLGKLTDQGALSINTGKFTGRSPKDRYIVKDSITEDKVWWGNINIPFDSDKFQKLYDKVTDYLSSKEVFVRDAYACADDNYSRYVLNPLNT